MEGISCAVVKSKTSHTLSQLPLSLVGLEFESTNSITQTILLLPELLHLELFKRRDAGVRGRRSGTLGAELLLRLARGQTAFLQLALCDERLLATLQLVEVGGDTVEQRLDFWLDLGEQGRLCGLQFGFGDEFEVLGRQTMSRRATSRQRAQADSYPSGLQDSREARKVAGALVEDVDGRVEQLHARPQRGHAALERVCRTHGHGCAAGRSGVCWCLPQSMCM